MRGTAKTTYTNNNIPSENIPEELQRQMIGQEPSSGVAWSAIIGGAFVATAVSLILVVLGSGIGFSVVSALPTAETGAEGVSFPYMTAMWIIAIQVIASGFGGYLTGRLRTKWTGLHTKEVFFRDTANGFLSWAVATIFAAALFASAATMVISGSVKALSAVAAPVIQNVSENTRATGLLNPNSYLISGLFRSDNPTNTGVTDADIRTETSNIILNSIRNGEISDTDRTYLASIIAARTGVSQSEALTRVDDVMAQVGTVETNTREALDAARRVSAQLALFVCVSLLLGALAASYYAAVGGRHRDRV
jgi:hypothetical protein